MLVLEHLEPELLLRSHLLPVEVLVLVLPLLPHAAVALAAMEHLLEELHGAALAWLEALLLHLVHPHLLHVGFLLVPHLLAAHHLVEHLLGVSEHLLHLLWLVLELDLNSSIVGLEGLGWGLSVGVLGLSLAEDVSDLLGDLWDGSLNGLVKVLLESLLDPLSLLSPSLALALVVSVLIGGGLVTGVRLLNVHLLLGLGLGDLDWLSLNWLRGFIRLSHEDLDGSLALKLLEEDLEVLFAVDSNQVLVRVTVLESESLEGLKASSDGLKEVVVAGNGPTDSVDLVVVFDLE